MEELELVIEEAPLKTEEIGEQNIAYEGLKLVETRAYKGGTSIKYWM
jgi:hypothetical protein